MPDRYSSLSEHEKSIQNLSTSLQVSAMNQKKVTYLDRYEYYKSLLEQRELKEKQLSAQQSNLESNDHIGIGVSIQLHNDQSQK